MPPVYVQEIWLVQFSKSFWILDMSSACKTPCPLECNSHNYETTQIHQTNAKSYSKLHQNITTTPLKTSLKKHGPDRSQGTMSLVGTRDLLWELVLELSKNCSCWFSLNLKTRINFIYDWKGIMLPHCLKMRKEPNPFWVAGELLQDAWGYHTQKLTHGHLNAWSS